MQKQVNHQIPAPHKSPQANPFPKESTPSLSHGENNPPQGRFTCSKSKIETLEKGVKYVQS